MITLLMKNMSQLRNFLEISKDNGTEEGLKADSYRLLHVLL